MTDLVLAVDQTRTEGLIGASDAAAILGLDPYRSPLAVAKRLRGEGESERPAFVREAAEWGQALEPVIRGKYAIETESLVLVPDASVTLDGWLRCTPDGYVSTAATQRSRMDEPTYPGDVGTSMASASTVLAMRDVGALDGLLQVKTCSAYKADEWKDGAVPPAYEVQCRVEMAVTGLPWCDIVCLVGGQSYVGPVRIVRDLEIEARILRDLRAFWDRCIVRGEDPDVDASQAWREHASSRMRPTGIELHADDSDLELLAAWKEARNEIAAATKREELCKTAVLLRLSDAGATKLVTKDGNVTSYPKGSSVSWKAYAQSLGAASVVPAQFQKPGKSWVVKAPAGWGGDEE